LERDVDSRNASCAQNLIFTFLLLQSCWQKFQKATGCLYVICKKNFIDISACCISNAIILVEHYMWELSTATICRTKRIRRRTFISSTYWYAPITNFQDESEQFLELCFSHVVQCCIEYKLVSMRVSSGPVNIFWPKYTLTNFTQLPSIYNIWFSPCI
jgi:hypothetical protein